MEYPVTFPNSNGEKLFGMIFRPDNEENAQKIGIIISVNSIKYRIGTFRYHTLLARKLSRQGYYVMYFDPAGIGDSEGIFEEKPLKEHHVDIQKGKYKEDTLSAINFFQNEVQLDKLLLFGLCGGAISMLIAAAGDAKVNGLILLGIPILYDAVNEGGQKKVFDETAHITSSEQASNVLLPILKKVYDVNSWKKVFCGKIAWRNEIKMIFKSIFILFIKNTEKIRRKLFEKTTKFDLESEVSVSRHARFNILFQQSFANVMKKRGKVIFIFGGQDPVMWQFKSEFQDIVLFPGNPFEDLIEIHSIENANHIFSSIESQSQLTETIEKWLQEKYPTC